MRSLCDPEDPRCAQYQQHFEQLQDANRQVCAEFEESGEAAREAGHALRAAHYEYELACKERMLALERKESALLRSALERAWALLDQLPELESAWKGMQNTQTEEQPAGTVLWGRAGRWVSGEHEPWDVEEGAEEGAGEEGEEEGEEEEEMLWVQQRVVLGASDALWVEREREDDVWDEEMAARAEEEMRLASAARSGLC